MTGDTITLQIFNDAFNDHEYCSIILFLQFFVFLNINTLAIVSSLIISSIAAFIISTAAR